MFRCPVRLVQGWCRSATRSLPVCRVVGVDEAANAELSARHADNHLVLDDERRDGRGVALLVVGHRRHPTPPPPVFMSSATRCASSVVMNSRSPSMPKPLLTRPQHAVSAARRRQLAFVAPDLAVRCGRRAPTPAFSGPVDVQHVVAQQRRRFECARACPVWNVHCGARRGHVLGRDLRERAVALVRYSRRRTSASASRRHRKPCQQLL